MDLVFLVSPFFHDYARVAQPGSPSSESPYTPESEGFSGIPEMDELLGHYAQIVGFDLRNDGGGKDWETATIFQYLRAGTISHGIQARTISGQASSDFGHIYFSKTKKSLDAAFQRVKNFKEEKAGLSKL
jgi:hypothetical protein